MASNVNGSLAQNAGRLNAPLTNAHRTAIRMTFILSAGANIRDTRFMPSRKIEQQLDLLSGLRAQGPTEQTLTALRKALANPINVVVAKAATIAADLALQPLVPDLCAAFNRLFENPARTDAQCSGKSAIGQTLKDLGYSESNEFVRGLHHVQMEPVWGGQEDTAAPLRGTCALALVQCTDITRRDTLRHLIDALADPFATVRTDVVRALEQLEGHEAALLLRLKARAGDEDAAVTGQVLESLLHLEQEAAIPFVTEFLKHGGAVGDFEAHRPIGGRCALCEEAALALGASRLPAAVEVLKQTWAESRFLIPEDVLLRAISSSRQDSAIEFLLDIVRTGREREAIAAIDALELHRASPEIQEQLTRAVASRGETATQERFQRSTNPPSSSPDA
jgi:hypothetical protein